MDAKRSEFMIDSSYFDALWKLCDEANERSRQAQEHASASSKRWNEVREQYDRFFSATSPHRYFK
jgi:hypothetical protein